MQWHGLFLERCRILNVPLHDRLRSRSALESQTEKAKTLRRRRLRCNGTYSIHYPLNNSHLEHLHHLVAEMVDDFNRDSARLGFVERSGRVAVECGPGFGVDFGF